MGDEIILKPHAGEVTNLEGELLTSFELKTEVIMDEVRANGRINLIIGRQLTDKARETLGLEPTDIFVRPNNDKSDAKGYTLAQKMVGKACGVEGVRPGDYCEPRMTTVGSQDTTGPMTRDELKELACLGFSADLVMQSFCHTAAYPKPVDIETQHFPSSNLYMNRGGVSLKPGLNMDQMKFDMCGSAVVFGVMNAIAELQPKMNVVAIVPSTHNMLGGSAYKPGDILTAYNGKTIEVLNTDAEGRLILADALAYASKHYDPEYMLDFATLTGAVVITLGHIATGIMKQ